MLAFTSPEQFVLEQGESNLTDYQFNRNVVHHLFCKTCGIKAFGRGIGPDGKEMVAVNVRCLENVDLAKVPTHHFDGKAL